MPRRTRFSIAALGLFAVTAVLASDPARAATHGYSTVDHPRSCRHLANPCRTYSYLNVYPHSEPVYPPGSYPFRYEPPLRSNGPYLGYEPYDGYESALGFFF